MPDFYSLPYELRDDIYKHVLSGNLPSNATRSLFGLRKRVSRQPPPDKVIHEESTASPSTRFVDEAEPVRDSAIASSSFDDVGYYSGEENIRYPLLIPQPSGNALLRASRQLRAELLNKISRTRIRYKIHLAFRNDTDVVYPSWISVPAFSNRVDVLDVEVRFRPHKTSSLCSANGDDDGRELGDPLLGSLALLERFLERGVDFLSRKRGKKITVGLLAVQIMIKGFESPNIHPDEYDEWIEAIGSDVDEWFRDTRTSNIRFPDGPVRADQLICLFAERIDRFSIQIEESKREWDMKEVLIERRKFHEAEKSALPQRTVSGDT